jgi:hypothetical protein
VNALISFHAQKLVGKNKTWLWGEALIIFCNCVMHSLSPTLPAISYIHNRGLRPQPACSFMTTESHLLWTYSGQATAWTGESVFDSKEWVRKFSFLQNVQAGYRMHSLLPNGYRGLFLRE